jgi:hypothetical protein
VLGSSADRREHTDLSVTTPRSFLPVVGLNVSEGDLYGSEQISTVILGNFVPEMGFCELRTPHGKLPVTG